MSPRKDPKPKAVSTRGSKQPFKAKRRKATTRSASQEFISSETVRTVKEGRPTDYRPEHCELARKLCLLRGMTDQELAFYFDVTEGTINNWKKAHPEFLQSIKEGKTMADANIAASLYERARGYTHEEVHVSNYQGDITLTPLKKHYPPDTAAAIIWLKNRQPGAWRDRIEHTGKDGEPLIPPPIVRRA